MTQRYLDLPGPRGPPLPGCVLTIRPASMHCQLEARADRYGPTYRFRMGPSQMLVLAHFHIESAMTGSGNEPEEHLAFTMAPAGLQLMLSPRHGAGAVVPGAARTDLPR